MVEEKKQSKKPVGKKKAKKAGPIGIVHIKCSFNNTIVTVTDEKGNSVSWSSSGANNFKGTKKGTPFAAQITCSKAVQKAYDMGVRQVSVKVSGPGPGRETAIRAISSIGVTVTSIKDVTTIPHNGCRPPKARRV
ncbi:MAG: 30S ribosomal protein S11 [Elusimicrobiaceae bacterium]|nr:30S ribosomal protein S11 [Elusimicrobiaceae bacterium]MBT3955254.1 30S ribosomal protein S11 [Elusimicrobiaceae bacterium]MBT4007768.1 30S ribosomal protein S11 [Elusimicrobiaceae bacterium]MBT4402414.1 30S ribosomal protein S11 [Elusimicrobiaceae bacterium]MBT4440409.1 30S ribosomal protein S11 [Elusimicrobiaceae bacterium]